MCNFSIPLLDCVEYQSCVFHNLFTAILDENVRFIDTADTYCANGQDLHYAEKLIAQCIASLPPHIQSQVVVATKGGMGRYGDGTVSAQTWRATKMTPASLRKCILASKKALGVSKLQLWQIHHCDAYHGDSDEFVNLLMAANQAVMATMFQK